MSNQNQYQKTTSLALAAAIQAYSENKLLFVERSLTNKSTFVFADTPDLTQTINKFWRKELLLDALTYFEALRYIKARLYEGQEE
jgi:hypothetical protein